MQKCPVLTEGPASQSGKLSYVTGLGAELYEWECEAHFGLEHLQLAVLDSKELTPEQAVSSGQLNRLNNLFKREEVEVRLHAVCADCQACHQ